MDEASALTKAKVTARSEAEDACIWFHDKGVPCVVMTMRESGAIVSVNVLDGAGGQGKCKFLSYESLSYYATS
jgi:sugar/nucleoside kinase (ribokinase family)